MKKDATELAADLRKANRTIRSLRKRFKTRWAADMVSARSMFIEAAVAFEYLTDLEN